MLHHGAVTATPASADPVHFQLCERMGREKEHSLFLQTCCPPFQCRLVLGNGHFDQRLITVSCLPLYCPLISLSVEETSACCGLYNNGET